MLNHTILGLSQLPNYTLILETLDSHFTETGIILWKSLLKCKIWFQEFILTFIQSVYYYITSTGDLQPSTGILNQFPGHLVSTHIRIIGVHLFFLSHVTTL